MLFEMGSEDLVNLSNSTVLHMI